MAESVELATIVITDLVGSTRLATSVGPARADELREEHFELLRDAISSAGGREVKNTGDGLMVAFSSASAAVRCAVAMQQLFDRRYRDAEQELHIRIGLGAGESTVKDGDYFGMPSIEAARLCAQAPADGILISALVRSLAGRCEGIEFESVGALELKGFEQPVEALSVSWAPLAQEHESAGRWPLPAVLRSVPPVTYVGRVPERAALEGEMSLARSGERQVALLAGEPGIGKTRLASYAAHQAHGGGFVVGWGGCSEELAVPYEPWIAVCSHIVAHAPQELLAAHVARHGGELDRLARNLRERVPGLPGLQSSDPDTERFLLFSAVVGLLEHVAESAPVCIVLDDLHWADAQSVALLKHVVRSMEAEALHVVATYRDSDLSKDHPLSRALADLRPVAGVQRIQLEGLDVADITQLMTAVAGHELEADGLELAAQIRQETDGNPFFVGEILRGLSESGGLVFDETTSRWSVDGTARISLPESVREVIERRVERLGEETAEVLTLASVIGRSFDFELVAAVSEMGEAQLLDHLETAVAASVLAESTDRVGQFRFAHALINQTLYESLGTTRRARMHQRVAQALEQLYGRDPAEHLAELALHWRLAAVAVDRAKAADYALRAGHRALEGLAPDEALTLFGDAVELIGDADSIERCDALVGLGEAQRQTGDARYRETLLEAARLAHVLKEADLAATAVSANSRILQSVMGELDDERLLAIERAIELDEPSEPRRRSRLLALQSVELTWGPDFARRRALAEEAIALARGAGDRRSLADVLRWVSYGLWTAETLDLRAALSEELSALAASAGDPALRFWARDVEFNVHVERGDLARADAVMQERRFIAEELGQPLLRWIATFPAATIATMRGDLAEAERLAERAFQFGQEAGQSDAVLVYGGQLMSVRFYEGRGTEVIEMLEQSVQAYPGIAAWRAALAAQLCWVDRHDEARAILDEAARDGFRHVQPGPASLGALVSYAEAAAMMGAADHASVLYGLMEPCAEQVVWTSVTCYGHARMWLGLLAEAIGDHEKADEYLQRACDFQEAGGLLFWAARGHIGWAEGLAARGEMVRAREHATRAAELGQAHGFGAVEERAAAVLAAGSPATA